MATIQSLGTSVTVGNTWQSWTAGRQYVTMYDDYSRTYAQLYREQPNVRVCVDFLARNIAQLGLHFFRRIDDSNRERVNDHPVAVLLRRPLPAQYKVTQYRLIEATVADLGVYFNAYWLKLRSNGETTGLLRIPPQYVEVGGGIVTTGYKMTIGGKVYQFGSDEIVHFKGYNPESAIIGLSPLETLRRVLAEEDAMGNYRQGFWQNAARMGGIVKRPAAAPEWSDAARERFRLEFEELYSGASNSGKTAILEEGMEWAANTFNAQESEYLGGRKLTREECARAYHIPLPMVGILDNATFSNIEEQHKNLYQDTIGPVLAMMEQDIATQLLSDYADSDNVYCEFNIAEKLQGDFEQQTKSLQSAVGRPWMTANEARARMNMPQLEGDAGQLVTPLNVLIGGQASPNDSAPPPKQLHTKAVDSYKGDLRSQHERQWQNVLVRHYERQRQVVKSAIGAKAVLAGQVWFDLERWNRELGEDLYRLNTMTATTWAELVAEELGGDVSEKRMENWLREHSRIQAENINSFTQSELETALTAPEPETAVNDLFVLALTVWAIRQAISGVTTATNFGSNEAAKAAGLRRKTWRVNSANPRDEHAMLNGMTIGIRETFPNGQKWPGDPAGGAENNANCQCSVIFS